jgi:hypothetical protein
MAQGMNNSAACRQVGINRKTGNRWRYGRTMVDSTGERSKGGARRKYGDRLALDAIWFVLGSQ